MLHFVEMAFALLGGGAAVLTVAGLVRETLPDNGRHLHLFPETHDPPESAVAKAAKIAPLKDKGPFPHSGEKKRHEKRGRSRGGKSGARSKERRKKQRKGAEPCAGKSRREAAAENDEA